MEKKLHPIEKKNTHTHTTTSKTAKEHSVCSWMLFTSSKNKDDMFVTALLLVVVVVMSM